MEPLQTRQTDGVEIRRDAATAMEPQINKGFAGEEAWRQHENSAERKIKFSDIALNDSNNPCLDLTNVGVVVSEIEAKIVDALKFMQQQKSENGVLILVIETYNRDILP